uniref:Uncharacterized protein n=1 Tax=Moschus moschiferus TaxID=68415 RepID=A0A8C6CTE1_MOSMO
MLLYHNFKKKQQKFFLKKKKKLLGELVNIHVLGPPPARGAVGACAGPSLGVALMECLDYRPDFLSEEDCRLKAINVDLQNDAALQVDISDALSERDKVNFTVHTPSYIIPPAPPRPDFDASREKLQKPGEGEGSMPKEEFTKMKQELEAGWTTEILGFILLLPPSSASFFVVLTE